MSRTSTTSFARAVEAGATVIRPVADRDHGDRMGGVQDPFGYSWWLASRVKDGLTDKQEDQL